MSDILIGVIVFGLVFGAAIFGMFLGRNLRVLCADILHRRDHKAFPVFRNQKFEI